MHQARVCFFLSFAYTSFEIDFQLLFTFPHHSIELALSRLINTILVHYILKNYNSPIDKRAVYNCTA